MAWSELGPKPLEQTLGRLSVEVSGRVAGLAIAEEARQVYVATANGGVWRSEDQGRSWTFTMRSFDRNPQHHAADTLACGAIALDPAKPERVFVGTGEANTGRYYGIGPLYSCDAGDHWTIEPSTPNLAGAAFFELALHPDDPEVVVGATSLGLFCRTLDGGSPSWIRVPDDSTAFTSVRGGQLDGRAWFVAARLGGPIYLCDAARTAEADQWVAISEGLPDEAFGRISLAVQGEDLSVLYALAAREDRSLSGLFRYDHQQSEWRRIDGLPRRLFSDHQGDWSQALAIDPSDARRVYVGGSSIEVDDDWLGSLYRCELDADERQLSPTFVGLGVHADIQALAFEPGNPDRLWVGTDGGVFRSESASSAVGRVLDPRNTDLATVTLHHIAHHPENDSFVCGSQDNGVVRYRGAGDQRWETIYSGDCGYVVADWSSARLTRVLASIGGNFLTRLIEREPGGPFEVDVDVTVETEDDLILFYPPLVGTPVPDPIDPSNVHRSRRVAFGSNRPWISDDFGETWRSIPSGTVEDRLESRIRSLAFSSFHRLYAGTETGEVYRFDFDLEQLDWTWFALARRDLPQHFSVPITDIVADPAVADGSAIYVTLGGDLRLAGESDFRRLWRWDGQRWESRSGPVDDSHQQLLPVQHNAVAVDPRNPKHIWVGADIGVWFSKNAGKSWEPLQQDLPDAAVIDLKLHPKLRLLRASTHGRGAFELCV